MSRESRQVGTVGALEGVREGGVEGSQKAPTSCAGLPKSPARWSIANDNVVALQRCVDLDEGSPPQGRALLFFGSAQQAGAALSLEK